MCASLYLGCVETCKQMPSVFSPSPTATYLHVLIKELRSPSNRFKESGGGSSRCGWHTHISGPLRSPVLYYSLQNNLLYLGIKGGNLGALLRPPRPTRVTRTWEGARGNKVGLVESGTPPPLSKRPPGKTRALFSSCFILLADTDGCYFAPWLLSKLTRLN